LIANSQFMKRHWIDSWRGRYCKNWY